ncbi:tRNA(5-methylaminomethyl-2-thiouridylate) methyltransferase [Desulfovibrionales bacterium]
MQYDALALFSGGLDSILAAKMIINQGLRVKCIHFLSPFFGKPHKLRYWRERFGLDVETVDVGEAYIRMLVQGPPYGFGKFLNPCIDCKILLLTTARDLLPFYGANFLITGEVLGQRPMSQRHDALNIISRDAKVRNVLLRPLSAKRLNPSPMELSGQVDRRQLYDIAGRSRKDQLKLAKHYELPEIPTPAGGCMLAEIESARRYLPILEHATAPELGDFILANTGRQHWQDGHWLISGRNQRDNLWLETMITGRDLIFKTLNFPGPLCVGRQFAGSWSTEVVHKAAALCAGLSTKAREAGVEIFVQVTTSSRSVPLIVQPHPREAIEWIDPPWDKKRKRMLTKHLVTVGQPQFTHNTVSSGS